MKIKNVLNVGWKAGVIVVSLFFAIVLADDVFNKLRDFFHPWQRVDFLTENVMVKTHCRRWKQCLYNVNTGKRISNFKFGGICGVPQGDSITVFTDLNGKRGFININTGEIVIPAMYKQAWVFSEGKAAVVGDDDSLRFIRRDGRPAFDKAFDYSPEFEYYYRNGLCIIKYFSERGEKFGLIGHNGDWKMPMIDGSITDADRDGWYLVYLNTENDERRIGLLDENGEWIFRPEYQGISFSTCDNSIYLVKDYVKSHVSDDNKVLEPFVLDSVCELSYNMAGEMPNNDEGEPYCRQQVSTRVAKYSSNDLYGILDLRTGKPLTKACFSNIYMASENVVRCQLEGSLSEVLYDLNRKIIQ